MPGTDLTRLKGVGTQLAGKLSSLGIFYVEDLIFHLPSNYQDRTSVTSLGALQAGSDVLFCGVIEACSIVFSRQRTLLAKINDGSRLVNHSLVSL